MPLFGELNKPTRVIKYTPIDSTTIRIEINNEAMTIKAELLDSFIQAWANDYLSKVEFLNPETRKILSNKIEDLDIDQIIGLREILQDLVPEEFNGVKDVLFNSAADTLTVTYKDGTSKQITFNYVKKEAGKGLSTNDFSTSEKNKLSQIDNSLLNKTADDFGKVSDVTVDGQSVVTNKIANISLNGLLYNPSYDSATHTFRMDVKGTSQPFEIDFPIESLISNITLDENDNLVLHFEDGSEVSIPLNTLLIGVVKSVNNKTPDSNGQVVININDIEGLTDRLDTFIVKNQGLDNANKSLIVGEDGKVTLKELKADNIPYSNLESELDAENTQEAVDELNQLKLNKEKLNGGLTNQILQKNSNDDLDFEWQNLPEAELPSIPANPADNYLGLDGEGNKIWRKVSVGTSGYSAKLYLSNIDSDVETYKKLGTSLDITETEITKTANNAEKLMAVFLYDDPLGTDIIDAGTWNATLYSRVDNAGNATRFKFNIFLYNTDGTETELFEALSEDINNTTYAYISTNYSTGVFNVNPTSRLGVRVSMVTTRTSPTALYFKIGDGYASYVTTPLALRHIQLRLPNEDPNFQHITKNEQTFDGDKTFNNNIKVNGTLKIKDGITDDEAVTMKQLRESSGGTPSNLSSYARKIDLSQPLPDDIVYNRDGEKSDGIYTNFDYVENNNEEIELDDTVRLWGDVEGSLADFSLNSFKGNLLNGQVGLSYIINSNNEFEITDLIDAEYSIGLSTVYCLDDNKQFLYACNFADYQDIDMNDGFYAEAIAPWTMMGSKLTKVTNLGNIYQEISGNELQTYIDNNQLYHSRWELHMNELLQFYAPNQVNNAEELADRSKVYFILTEDRTNLIVFRVLDFNSEDKSASFIMQHSIQASIEQISSGSKVLYVFGDYEILQSRPQQDSNKISYTYRNRGTAEEFRPIDDERFQYLITRVQDLYHRIDNIGSGVTLEIEGGF